jgi:hypothetical protein
MNFSSDSKKKAFCPVAASVRKTESTRHLALADERSEITGYPTFMTETTGKGQQVRLGLCANCRFMRQITSDRGSTFYQCQLSATDPNFPKYPRLPVLHCTGYDPSHGIHEDPPK